MVRGRGCGTGWWASRTFQSHSTKAASDLQRISEDAGWYESQLFIPAKPDCHRALGFLRSGATMTISLFLAGVHAAFFESAS